MGSDLALRRLRVPGADFSARMHVVTSSLLLNSYVHILLPSSITLLLRTYFVSALAVWVSRRRPPITINTFYERSQNRHPPWTRSRPGRAFIQTPGFRSYRARSCTPTNTYASSSGRLHNTRFCMAPRRWGRGRKRESTCTGSKCSMGLCLRVLRA